MRGQNSEERLALFSNVCDGNLKTKKAYPHCEVSQPQTVSKTFSCQLSKEPLI